MDILASVFSILLHIDKYLGEIIANYGVLSYLILFLIIFAETGFVFTPFLPGDSLLFAAGAFSAIGSFNIAILLLVLWAAAFLGDTANYWIGHFFGQKLVDNPKIPINQEHIHKTHQFFAKHGGKSIFLARFVPVVRTMAPFVAGIGKMEYKKFIVYNITGGFTWIIGFTLLGYFFGNIPAVKENFSFAVIAIIVFSVVPIIIEFIKARLAKSKMPLDLTTFYQKYPKEKIDEAVSYLSYHTAKPMPKDENPAYPILYVFRHGQTTDNAEFLFSGWRDPNLTELGIKQVKILAEKLKDKKLHMLVASDQERSIKTMEIAVSLNDFAKKLEIHQDTRLKERSYGNLQGSSKLEMQLTNPKLLLEYRRSYDIKPPNGESISDVVKRVKLFIDEIVPLMKMYKMNVAVSCHGNSIRGFRQVFEGLTNDQTALVESPLGQDYAAYSIK